MANTDSKEEKTLMHPDKLNQEKTDQEIRKGAGTDNTQQAGNNLNNRDIPDSTNQSTGNTGSGQRQDSN